MKLIKWLLTLLPLAATIPALAQQHSAQPTCLVTSEQNGVLYIAVTPPSSTSLIAAKAVVVCYGNLFRFDLGPKTTQVPIGAAALPSSLGLSASQISKLPTGPAPAPGAPVPGAQAVPLLQPNIPEYPEACNQADTVNKWPSGTEDRKSRISKCWLGIEGQVGDQQNALLTVRQKINVLIREEAEEQRCYQQKLLHFRQPILTRDQAIELLKFASENAAHNQNSCHQTSSDTLQLGDADIAAVKLTQLQQALSDLVTAPGYPDWANTPGYQNANAALEKEVGDLISEATSYSTGSFAAGTGSGISQTSNDFQNVVANNKHWRDQLAALLSVGAASPATDLYRLAIPIPIAPCSEWYGKGRTDTINLHSVDLSTTAGTSQDTPIATNTCNPMSIASSGVGVTFLESPVFGFVPGDNAGSQVIGETATNKQSPLYAVFYNVKLGNSHRGLEFFASPGVGLTSASSTTNTDFLGGLSLSLARRVLFITPSADFGRRDRLATGFKLGDAKNALTSVPTQSHWPVGFMISLSFGIPPS